VQSVQDRVTGGSIRAIRGHSQRDRDAGWRNEDIGVGTLGGQLAQDFKAELGVWLRQRTCGWR
jgi:hypothetical protein